MWCGLHPDEATDAIVRVAENQDKPFAVVPCCVFASQFDRRLENGNKVRTHGALCAWILSGCAVAAGPRRPIRAAVLNFVGANRCIYSVDTVQEPSEVHRAPSEENEAEMHTSPSEAKSESEQHSNLQHRLLQLHVARPGCRSNLQQIIQTRSE